MVPMVTMANPRARAREIHSTVHHHRPTQWRGDDHHHRHHRHHPSPPLIAPSKLSTPRKRTTFEGSCPSGIGQARRGRKPTGDIARAGHVTSCPWSPLLIGPWQRSMEVRRDLPLAPSLRVPSSVFISPGRPGLILSLGLPPAGRQRHELPACRSIRVGVRSIGHVAPSPTWVGVGWLHRRRCGAGFSCLPASTGAPACRPVARFTSGGRPAMRRGFRARGKP